MLPGCTCVVMTGSPIVQLIVASALVPVPPEEPTTLGFTDCPCTYAVNKQNKKAAQKLLKKGDIENELLNIR